MGRNPTPDPEWYVYVEDFNARTIKPFNVFNSCSFLRGCKEAFKKYGDKKLEEEIDAWARYSFWSKCEYEIIITSWPPAPPERKFNNLKVDVYNQLKLNWDAFFKYVLDHKAYFLRRNK